MQLSVFDLFSIGIGPSSSHTVGPMKAAYAFREALLKTDWCNKEVEVVVTLYGSLGFTCHGHGTNKAVFAGLEGHLPHEVDPDHLERRIANICSERRLQLHADYNIVFNPEKQLICNLKETLPGHSNACRFEAKNSSGKSLCRVYYSVGGGFIEEASSDGGKVDVKPPYIDVPYPFACGKDLFTVCEKNDQSIADIIMKNEKILHPGRDVKKDVLGIAKVMEASMQRGLKQHGKLPGGLNVIRRASHLYDGMQAQLKRGNDPIPMQWLNVFAMAVNEENAAGGRVVTAPTNGAAGVIPAVLAYYKRFHCNISDDDVVNFLLTAAAIGFLYKENASISGAEMGCQGEVGVASSMAAGALTAALGGNLVQVENAAEIAMEHHLGMTCDPVGGLVQVPCIERNAMGAVKAVNATILALASVDPGIVSLDQVIATMYETGKNMHAMYKETSQGGLAVNVVEC